MMTGKKPNPPSVSSPEFKAWLKEQTAKDFEELLDPTKLHNFDEIGVLSGSEELLDKTDAELFPDEIEEYTPEERRKGFKVHTQNKD